MSNGHVVTPTSRHESHAVVRHEPWLHWFSLAAFSDFVWRVEHPLEAVDECVSVYSVVLFGFSRLPHA